MSLILWGREVIGTEKPSLLSWDSSRIIKTLFFEDGGSKIYGVSLPLDKKIELKSLSDFFEISKRKASSMKLSKKLPYLQRPGSVAPFICDKDLSLVEKIVFDDLDFERFVDFSYPGKSEVSLQMKYSDAIEILLEKYYDKIKIGKLESKFIEEKIYSSTPSLLFGPDGFICGPEAKSEDFDRRYFSR